MASNNTKRQVHVSPGIYFSESELQVAAKSLGITNLGLVGETLKGPAFQNIKVTSWSQYQSYFGGTSTEKYKGSQFPKYELPYIAKSYLKESQSLQVVRVLGLSGVNAGPAWVISAFGEAEKVEGEGTDTDKGEEKEYIYTKESPMVVAVIRSRGEHKKAIFVEAANGNCPPTYEFDGLEYYAQNVTISPSSELDLNDGCDPQFGTTTGTLKINASNYGRFDLVVTTAEGEKKYSVSLNPTDRNYIYNVIGGDPEVGEAEIYVEELYDVALKELVERGELSELSASLVAYQPARIIPEHAPVDDFLLTDETTLKRKDIGKRFLCVSDICGDVKVHDEIDGELTTATDGAIYVVRSFVTNEGTREYRYVKETELADLTPKTEEDGGVAAAAEEAPKSANYSVFKEINDIVYVNSVNTYYFKNEGTVYPLTLDMNNYKEQYRYSSTPWVVSQLMGSAKNVELTKLFRFHTISDGSNSHVECKISIENIDTETDTFDVVVRDFADNDMSPVVLERYKGVNLIPGSPNYIAYRIGSFNDDYETKSKYITVEVNETEKTKHSVPCGFLGYPVRNYEGHATVAGVDSKTILQKPFLQYNTNVYDEIRPKKQYFGMSDLVGIDTDVLKYKGVEAYNEDPDGLTPCFHLDSRILEERDNTEIGQIVMVDGVDGYTWRTVGKGNTVGDFGIEPRIGTYEEMLGSIYEDKRYRKFTMCFYGGWDGWDHYRTSRSNTDDFKYQRYRGTINSTSGESESFSVINDPELYGFDKSEKCITSDWYAYLSAIRQFANPKENDINVLATPGIDYVNNKLLVDEVIEMVEEERADSIYVITTPDKPFGAGDSKSEMFTSQDAVDNLEESDIDTNWACTYYPWVKYYDSTNSQYIYLPPTVDVVRDFAYTDNVAAPWYAAAGWNRGLSEGVKSKKNLVLSEQDELYSGRINFINNFAEEGMRIWGDNNLQIEQSAAHMNKISTRRCLIRLRKLISIACIGLVFDPNDNTTVSSFRSAVQPILEDFISKRALVDAKLVIDDSEESRDRLELNAQIYLKFMPNLEYINIGLIATPNGVSFDDI